MHATVQPGGCSPKPVSVPTSASQLNPGPDNLQNSTTAFSSQAKGKKRERGEQGSELVKRERSSKTDDDDSGQFKAESILKLEIAKITEKGGLVDAEGVEKLVQLMQPDRVERKMDVISRSMLAGVVAATDKFECLNQFVQLRGLPVFDEWLQDFHKGKIGDGGGPKDGDKSVEEFLLVLLRALDKLPVNLHALQMCNIGRSVNYLRTHKNSEIQKKSRSLVDTWKKRVQAEMNVIDAKCGSNQAVSWPSKSRVIEVSHGGNRHPCGSSDGTLKSSVTQLSTSKSALVKTVQGETAVKATSTSPGPNKSALSPAAGKDIQPRNSVNSSSDLPLTAREEKSSSSSQSHNYSQSFLGKEDMRSSTTGSMGVNNNKISSGASRHRKSINGFPGVAVSGGQRETGSSRCSPLHRNSASEKLLQTGLTGEKAVDVPIVDGNSHKLIVKIPNRVQSPAQGVSGGSSEDPSTINSIGSSPVLGEKHDRFDSHLKEKGDGYQPNITLDVSTEAWPNNDLKDVPTGFDEGDGSPAIIADDERSRSVEDDRKLTEGTKAVSLSSGNELRSEKLHETSFNSMKALIESCVRYSEANALMSPGDDVGMNLLASVAAGEMSKSNLVSPSDSPQRNTPVVEETCLGDDARSKASPGNNFSHDESQAINDADGNNEQVVLTGTSLSEDGVCLLKLASAKFSGDKKTACSTKETRPGEQNQKPTVNPCHGSNEKLDEKGSPSVAVSHVNVSQKLIDGEVSKLQEEKAAVNSVNVDRVLETKQRSISLSTVEKVNDVLLTTEDEKRAVDIVSAFIEIVGRKKDDVNECFNSVVHAEQKSDTVMVNSEDVEKTNKEMLHPTSSKSLIPENSDDTEVEKGNADISSHTNQDERPKTNQKTDDSPAHEHCVANSKSDFMGTDVENKEMVQEHHSGVVVPQKGSSAFLAQKTDEHVGSWESKLTGVEADEKEECAITRVGFTTSSAAGERDTDSKLEFDLNEGFNTDDVKHGEPINLVDPGCSSTAHMISPLPFAVSSVSSNLPASITVAAAAKGPFVPPDDLLRTKGELGWKGSAATSAFRPAEPRKILEMPPDAASSGCSRSPLDIDLNMPDERVLKEMLVSDLVHSHIFAQSESLDSVLVCSSGGRDLDLNRVDEANDMVQHSASASNRSEAPILPLKSAPSSRILNDEVRRDFDLNDGPSLDDTSAEPSSSLIQQSRGSMHSQPSLANLRVNNPVIGNFSSWFPPPSNYPAVAVPSLLPDRGEQLIPIVAPGVPQRLLGPVSGGSAFASDVYLGSVLSSSPALPFPSTPFQYPVFPFGTSFPLPSATFSGGSTTHMESSSGGRVCFPVIHSQLLGPTGAVSSQSARPCGVNIPDGSSNGGVENNGKGVRQGLDLNTGPGVVDLEGRNETLPLTSKRLSVTSSQALGDEEARMYMTTGVLKRKEPEGGWDAESFRYKQSSWH